MTKLLSSNFSRLAKNKVFWLGIAVVLVLSVVNMLNFCRQVENFDGIGMTNLENKYFELMPILGIFTAVIISLFFGTEYSDGTMRNKIMIGHTRVNIYLSAVITGAFISSMLTIVCFVGGLVGIPSLGVWEIPISQIILYMLVGILLSIALSAIFVFVGMICSNKAAGAVIAILLALVLMICGSIIYNVLNEPEMVSEMMLTSDGKVTQTEPHLNPDYVGGTLRTVLEFLLLFLPTGQAILMSNTELVQPTICIVYSIILSIAVTGFGLVVYRKKDLK